jgi:hypothetical protein
MSHDNDQEKSLYNKSTASDTLIGFFPSLSSHRSNFLPVVELLVTSSAGELTEYENFRFVKNIWNLKKKKKKNLSTTF